MSKPRSSLVHALLAMLVMAGCAPSFGGGPDGAQPVATSDVQVRVENHNWSDVTVYLVRVGMRSRLGTVTSMNQRTFDVPRAIMASSANVRLLVDPIGSRSSYLTEPIMVNPGQTIDLTLENNLNLSSYSVW